MPVYVIRRLMDALNSRRKALRGSRILVLGLAYKPNVDDDRESPSYILMDHVAQQGAGVAYHEPHVQVIRPTREHPHWEGTKSVPWTKAEIGKYDAVLIATAHESVNYSELARWAGLIVDTRNAMALVRCQPKKIWKA